MWEGLKTGLPRALGRAIVMGAWAFSSYFIIHKGGDYLLVYSFGVTLFGLFSFIADGMGQALISLTSYSLGARMDETFHKIVKTSFKFVLIMGIILGIPLFFMQDLIIHFIIKISLAPETLSLLKETCIWIWVGSIGSGINRIGIGFITASRDTLFYAVSASFLWITFCIPVYAGIELLSWDPSKIFMIDFFNSSIIGGIFIFRFLRSPYRKLV